MTAKDLLLLFVTIHCSSMVLGFHARVQNQLKRSHAHDSYVSAASSINSNPSRSYGFYRKPATSSKEQVVSSQSSPLVQTPVVPKKSYGFYNKKAAEGGVSLQTVIAEKSRPMVSISVSSVVAAAPKKSYGFYNKETAKGRVPVQAVASEKAQPMVSVSPSVVTVAASPKKSYGFYNKETAKGRVPVQAVVSEKSQTMVSVSPSVVAVAAAPKKSYGFYNKDKFLRSAMRSSTASGTSFNIDKMLAHASELVEAKVNTLKTMAVAKEELMKSAAQLAPKRSYGFYKKPNSSLKQDAHMYLSRV